MHRINALVCRQATHLVLCSRSGRRARCVVTGRLCETQGTLQLGGPACTLSSVKLQTYASHHSRAVQHVRAALRRVTAGAAIEHHAMPNCAQRVQRTWRWVRPREAI